jgi:hypothetical protein
MNPKLEMTAANTLASHKNAHKMVYLPTLLSLVGLVDGNGLDQLKSKLYVVSVPQFKQARQRALTNPSDVNCQTYYGAPYHDKRFWQKITIRW